MLGTEANGESGFASCPDLDVLDLVDQEIGSSSVAGVVVALLECCRLDRNRTGTSQRRWGLE